MAGTNSWSLNGEVCLAVEDSTTSCDNEEVCTADWTDLFEYWAELDQLSSSDTSMFNGVKNPGNSPVCNDVSNSDSHAFPTAVAPSPPCVLSASLLRQVLLKRDQKPKLDDQVRKCPCPASRHLMGTSRRKAWMLQLAPPQPSLPRKPLRSGSEKGKANFGGHDDPSRSLAGGPATVDACGAGTNNKMVTSKRSFASLDDDDDAARETQRMITRIMRSSKVECETARRRKMDCLFYTLRANLPFGIPENDRCILIDKTCHYIAFLQRKLRLLKVKAHILKSIMDQERRNAESRPNEDDVESHQAAPKVASDSQSEISEFAPQVRVRVSEGQLIDITISCYEGARGLFSTFLAALEQRGLDVGSANRSQNELAVMYVFHATVRQSARPCCLDIKELKADLFGKALLKP